MTLFELYLLVNSPDDVAHHHVQRRLVAPNGVLVDYRIDFQVFRVGPVTRVDANVPRIVRRIPVGHVADEDIRIFVKQTFIIEQSGNQSFGKNS